MTMWRVLWRGWVALVHRVGAFQARVVLTLIYFVVVAPFSLVVKLGHDPLRMHRLPSSNWTARSGEPGGLAAARLQS
jgi:hypothetical protein